MKRLVLSLACAALCACSTPTTQPPADLVSPQALARSGSLLFVASTNSDELRVLQLADDPNARIFLPAPNPLYVLSVPVVTRPIALAADDDGHGHTGAYVFALSSVVGRLGVVVAADQKEEAEVALPGTPLAVAARTVIPADGSAPDGSAKAYVGVLLGENHGAIAEVDVPPSSQLGSATLSAKVLYDLGVAAPRGLAISPDGKTLAIGDRLADERNSDPTQRRGGLILLDLATGATNRVFVGGPASRVVYSPDVQVQDDHDAGCGIDAQTIPAGAYLYALVESSNCPLGQRCGGVQIVIDGGVPLLASGEPVPPARIPGTATDIAIASASRDGGNVHFAGVTCLEPPLLVAAPSTNGFVYFLDGENGSTYNIDATGPDAGEVDHFLDGGDLGADGTGPQRGTIDVANGGLEDQTIVVAYEGMLPALSERPAVVVSATDGGAQNALVDPAADFPALGVEAGDVVSFTGGAGNCPGSAVVSAALQGELELSTAGAIDPACYPVGGPATYSVRVGTPTAPYLVAGTIQGYLGRTADGSTSADGGVLFQTEIPYFWRGAEPLKPALTFVMGQGDPVQDAHWEFAVDNGVQVISVGGGSDAIQPGPAVWAPGLKKFYVGYPGSQLGSHLAEIDPALVAAGTSNNVGELQ